MPECNPLSTSIVANVKLDEEMKRIPYRELIGSLIHLANCTRPDFQQTRNGTLERSQESMYAYKVYFRVWN